MSEVIGLVVLAIIVSLAVAFISAFPVMLLWNALMPDLFGLAQIGFMQALGLSILCSILFKSSGSSSKK
jgi:hypothetical protein